MDFSTIWTALINNRELIAWTINGLVVVLGVLFKKMGISIDADIIEAACYEAYEVGMPDADRVRVGGRVPLENGRLILDKAITRSRKYLRHKKPDWLPDWLWKKAMKKISDKFIESVIEGIIELNKKRHINQ